MNLKKRRTFLKASALGLSGCLLTSTHLLASSTIDTLALAQKDLYGDFKDAPKFDELNARAYLSLILTHTRVSQAAKEYIKNGAKWLDEEAVLLYKKSYTSLSFEQRQTTLKSILGIMSLGVKGDTDIKIYIEGEDEVEAEVALKNYLLDNKLAV